MNNTLNFIKFFRSAGGKGAQQRASPLSAGRLRLVFFRVLAIMIFRKVFCEKRFGALLEKGSMKRLFVVFLSLILIIMTAACGSVQETTAPPVPSASESSEAPSAETLPAPDTSAAPSSSADPTTQETTEPPVPEVRVLSYDEYLTAVPGSEVVIEARIRFAAFDEENGTASLFLADEDGGYYVSDMAADAEQAALLAEGTLMRLSGRKTESSGEVRIGEVTEYELFDDVKTDFEDPDVTALLGKDELAVLMNRKVIFGNMTVVPSETAGGEEAAFLYRENGTGKEGDDLYFKAAAAGKVYLFTVKSSECGPETEVYQRVQALAAGDTVDLTGFLFWSDGPLPHIHAVRKAGEKSEGVMTHAEYAEAPVGSAVDVEAFVQNAAYNAESGNITLFLQDLDGGYYVDRMAVTAEEAARFTPGAAVRVRGLKSEWAGRAEIVDASFEPGTGFYLPPAEDISGLLDSEEEMARRMNTRVSVSGVTLVPTRDADGEALPFLYRYNGSGAAGENADLYFTVSYRGREYIMTVESDEWPEGSGVYTAVTELKIGDVLDLEGFLSWNAALRPHICAVKASDKPSDVALSYEDYINTQIGSIVTVDAYIQLAMYDEENGRISLFLASPSEEGTDGRYSVTGIKAAPEEAESFKAGAHIRVSGVKEEENQSPRIADAVYELISGSYLAETADITAADPEPYLYGSIRIRGLYVLPSSGPEGEERAFLYGEGGDLFFRAAYGGGELLLRVDVKDYPEESDLYAAAAALGIGQGLDAEGFLYREEELVIRLSSLEAAPYGKAEGVSNWYEYHRAEAGSELTVEARVLFVLPEEETLSLILHDGIGAYLVKGLPLPEEEEPAPAAGDVLLLSGVKAEDGSLTGTGSEASETDVPAVRVLGWSDLEGAAAEVPETLMFSPFRLLKAEVAPSLDLDGKEVPYLCGEDGRGQDGEDLYFTLRQGDRQLTFMIPSEERDSAVYQTVLTFHIGDLADIGGFLMNDAGRPFYITELAAAD